MSMYQKLDHKNIFLMESEEIAEGTIESIVLNATWWNMLLCLSSIMFGEQREEIKEIAVCLEELWSTYSE